MFWGERCSDEWLGRLDLGSQVCKTLDGMREELFAHLHQPTQVLCVCVCVCVCARVCFTSSVTYIGDKNSSDSHNG